MIKNFIARLVSISGLLILLAAAGCTSKTATERLPAEMTAGCSALSGKSEQARAGRATYRTLCTHCHQGDGSGVPGMVPALADSNRLAADPELSIRMVLASQSPAAHLEGMAVLDLVAPLEQLSDAEAADVLNYVLNAWGNCAGNVTVEDIERLRLSSR